MAEIIDFSEEKEKSEKKKKNEKLREIKIGDYTLLIELNESFEKYKDNDSLETQLNKDKRKLNLGLLENLILDKQEISLENILYLRDKEGFKDKPYTNVRYVSPSELPSGEGWRALGMYDPSNNTIYIANNLSPTTQEFVYHHEVAHALGIRDEGDADNYAASKVGYRIRDAA